MNEEIYSPTYIPGGPDAYSNYNYYGGNPDIRPRSPAFMTTVPDMMARESTYPGNSAFAPPGGINLGSPLMNTIGSMAMNMIFGGNVRPWTKPEGSAYDYAEARERHKISMMMSTRVSMMDPGLSRFGRLGDNPAFAMGMDFLNPMIGGGGGQNTTLQSIYSRMGTTFGGTQEQRAGMSASLLNQMNDTFKKGGRFDYRKSYGLDYTEMTDAMDSGLRYGIGGMTEDKFRAGVQSGKGGDMMGKNARIFAGASDIFGRDKSMDQLAQLLKKTVDGFSGLNEGDASQLLNKIQATAKSVNISNQALAQYQVMMNDLYKSMGMKGPATAASTLNAVMEGKVVGQMGLATGDLSLTDASEVMGMAGANKVSLQSSGAMQLVTAIGATMQDISPATRASIRMKNGTSLDSAGQALNAAIEAGDPNKMYAAVRAFDGVQSNPYFDMAEVRRRASVLSPEDLVKANKIMPAIAGAVGLRGREVIDTVAYNLSKNNTVMGLLGGKKGISAFIDTLEGSGQMINADAIREKLKTDPHYSHLTESQRDAVATNMVQAFSLEFNDERRARSRSFQDTKQLKVDVNAATPAGRAKIAKQKALAADLAVKYEAAMGVSGDIMRNYGIGGLINSAINIMPQMEGKNWGDSRDVAVALTAIGQDASGATDLVRLHEVTEGIGGIPGIQQKLKNLVPEATKAHDVELARSHNEDLAKEASEKTFKEAVAREGLTDALEASKAGDTSKEKKNPMEEYLARIAKATEVTAAASQQDKTGGVTYPSPSKPGGK